ncbi:MAG: hypothetical protein WCP16_08970 [Pseudanabaena sp. ELA645]
MLKTKLVLLTISFSPLVLSALQLPSYSQNLVSQADSGINSGSNFINYSRPQSGNDGANSAAGNTPLPLTSEQKKSANTEAALLLQKFSSGNESDRNILALISTDTDLTLLSPESLTKLKTEVLFAINEAVRLDSSDTILSSTIPTKNGVANLSTFYDAPKKEVTISMAGGKIANALIVSPTNQSNGSVKIGTKQPLLIPKEIKNSQAAMTTAIAVLASGGSANQAVVAAQVSGTGVDTTATVKLIAKLSGLISKGTGTEVAIAPERLGEAINTYNEVLDTSSPAIVEELAKNQAFIKIGETLRKLRSAIGN